MSSVPARLGAFAAGLAVAFAAAFGVGRLVGPVDDAPSSPPTTTVDHTDGHAGHGA